MRRTQKVVALSAGILLFLLTGAWAQQALGAAAQPATGPMPTPSKKKKSEKQKKWHGKLVDANCMVKAMNTVSVSALHSTRSGFPSSPGTPSEFGRYKTETAQEHPDQLMQQPIERQHNDVGRAIGSAGKGPSTDTAEMRKLALLDQTAKKCTATKSTSKFGLVMGSGRVMKFGKDGNIKAGEAVKEAGLKPHKAVKATVKGVESNRGVVHVTSVEINRKHKR